MKPSPQKESKRPYPKWLLLLGVILLIAVFSFDSQPELEILPPNATILALGDSLTYGTGVKRSQSYPAVLQTLTGLNVVNAGIPRETTVETLSRLQDELEKHSPDLVVLCIGGNDILRRYNKATIVNNIQQIIDAVKANDISIVLLAVPEFGLYPTAPDFYQQLAEINQIPIDNDTIPSVLRSPSLKSDAIHGNEAGYKKIAEGVYELLQDAGAIK